jgi:1-acyl-sn-glycerol-3-phosphate acyltransferase
VITFYAAASWATGVVARAIADVEVSGVKNIPGEGPVIIAPNHLHIADPPVLAAFLPRKIHYMVKQEAWEARFFGPICRGFEAFPVARGTADLSAYRASLRFLAQGRVIGIFPEGHRSRDGRLQPGQPGAIMLARRSRAPIVPIGIHGIDDALRHPVLIGRRTIRIAVGEPYFPHQEAKRDVAAATQELMERIAALLPPGTRRVVLPSSIDERVLNRE